MGRELRIIDSNAIYHVIPVGSDKGPIVFGGPEEFARLVHDGHLPVSDTIGSR